MISRVITQSCPRLILCILKIDHSIHIPLPARHRTTPENLATLGPSLDKNDWSSVYNAEDVVVNLSLDNFINIFKKKRLDEHIPKKNDIQVYNKTGKPFVL